MADVLSSEILAVVGAELKTNGGDRVRSMVADMLVEAELEKRATALKKVMDLLKQETKALERLGPDNKAFDVTGKVTSESYSKKQLDERAKVSKRVDKLIGAINKALGENSDYADVYNLQSGKLEEGDASGKSSGSGKPEGDAGDGATKSD